MRSLRWVAGWLLAWAVLAAVLALAFVPVFWVVCMDCVNVNATEGFFGDSWSGIDWPPTWLNASLVAALAVLGAGRWLARRSSV